MLVYHCTLNVDGQRTSDAFDLTCESYIAAKLSALEVARTRYPNAKEIIPYCRIKSIL